VHPLKIKDVLVMVAHKNTSMETRSRFIAENGRDKPYMGAVIKSGTHRTGGGSA
jgi:hypothetical protein